MIKEDVYKEDYTRASGRALYLLSKKHYGSINKLGEFLNVSRQYVAQMIEESIPANYAGILGRKHGLPPAIFAYEESLVLGYNTSFLDYFSTEAVKKIFSPRDIKYITAGSYVKNPKKYLAVVDANTVK